VPKLTPIKSCQECGDIIHGRADKKFCSDQCRVAFNNRLNSDQNNYVRNVNHALRKNRRLLLSLYNSGKTKVSRERLMQCGFDFNFFTNQHKTKDGAIYYYCYEHGYLPIDQELYLLVIKQDFAA
jgi:predicted nucleic acid-binding Zn ribbon protein